MDEGKGSASSSECPRAGYMRLKIFDNVVTVPTSCKTWRCLSCRDRVKSYVRMRMEHGILILKDCLLITVTYAIREGVGKKDAVTVGKDWAECTRLLNNRWSLSPPSQSPKMKWFRVPELTKKGQVHLHLIVGGIGERVACCRPGTMGTCRHVKSYAWAMEECRVDCLEHELAKVWYGVTGDSWVVDCRAVWSPAGASSYLFKYLNKGFDDREELEALGFKRRWSCSRDWPSPERMRFVVTGSKGWQSTQFIKKGSVWEGHLLEEVERSKNSAFSMKLGTDLAKQYVKRGEKKRTKQMVRKVMEIA